MDEDNSSDCQIEEGDIFTTGSGLTILFVFVILLTASVNFVTISIFVLMKMRSSRNFSEHVIVNQAVADFLVAVVSMTLAVCKDFHAVFSRAHYSPTWCFVHLFFQVLFCVLSAYSLLLINMDRYLLCVWPIQYRTWKKKHTLDMVWASPYIMTLFLFALPTLILRHLDVTEPDLSCHCFAAYCFLQEFYRSDLLFVLAANLLTPMTLIPLLNLVVYTNMHVRMRHRSLSSVQVHPTGSDTLLRRGTKLSVAFSEHGIQATIVDPEAPMNPELSSLYSSSEKQQKEQPTDTADLTTDTADLTTDTADLTTKLVEGGDGSKDSGKGFPPPEKREAKTQEEKTQEETADDSFPILPLGQLSSILRQHGQQQRSSLHVQAWAQVKQVYEYNSESIDSSGSMQQQTHTSAEHKLTDEFVTEQQPKDESETEQQPTDESETEQQRTDNTLTEQKQQTDTSPKEQQTDMTSVGQQNDIEKKDSCTNTKDSSMFRPLLRPKTASLDHSSSPEKRSSLQDTRKWHSLTKLEIKRKSKTTPVNNTRPFRASSSRADSTTTMSSFAVAVFKTASGNNGGNRLLKMLLLVVAIFEILFLPFVVTCLVSAVSKVKGEAGLTCLHKGRDKWEYRWWSNLTLWLVMINSLMNAVMYPFFHRNYRTGAFKLIKLCRSGLCRCCRVICTRFLGLAFCRCGKSRSDRRKSRERKKGTVSHGSKSG